MKPSDVAAEVETANLKLVDVIELPPYHGSDLFENSVHQQPTNVLSLVLNCSSQFRSYSES